nr:translation machinery-associated protein 16_ neuropeptide Y [Chiton albolineatus]
MPKAAKAKVGGSKKPIHPNSRKAGQLARQVYHEERQDRRKDERCKKLEILGDKLKFFQNCMQEEKSDYTKSDLVDMLECYFRRFDEELEQIAIVNSIGGRNGQRHASREHVIRLTQERERLEFETSGVEVPDLLSKKNLKVFREWTGELKFISNMKLRRISQKDKVQPIRTSIASTENNTTLTNSENNSALTSVNDT